MNSVDFIQFEVSIIHFKLLNLQFLKLDKKYV
jgi:hypothetical protein